MMKNVALTICLLVSTFIWASPNGDEYSINFQSASSILVMSPGMFGDAAAIQKISVLIDGKKYELSAMAGKSGLVALGDYKARLLKDEHKTTFESRQEYEFLFPDKTTRKFFVTGQSE
jgi:hypothetical protein